MVDVYDQDSLSLNHLPMNVSFDSYQNMMLHLQVIVHLDMEYSPMICHIFQLNIDEEMEQNVLKIKAIEFI